MSRSHTVGKLRYGLGIALSVTALVGLLDTLGGLQRLEWITYDYRMKLLRSDTPLHEEVAVVLIDESSLQAMEPIVGRFPWPRSVYADIVEFLAIGGARAVVFDILFSENESTSGNIGDERLAEATAAAGNVVHAAQLLHEEADEGDSRFLGRPLPQGFRERFALSAGGLHGGRNNSYILPIDRLIATSGAIGIVGVDADDDSVYRRINLFPQYGDATFPSLGIAAIAMSLADARVDRQGSAVHFGGRTLPLDEHGRYLVNMVGQIRPYSVGGLIASILKLRAGEVEDLLVYPDEFENRIVFVGASAVGLADIKTTPLSSKTPGVMIHASAASNFLSNDFLNPVGRTPTLFLVLTLSLLTVLSIFATHRVHLQTTAPLALAGGFFVAALLTFRAGVVLQVAPALAAIGLAWFASFSYLVFTEGRDKRRVRTMLSQYVSPAVLAEVVDRYEDHLKAEVGATEHISILFSDVRGFTSISERLTATQVVELLNIHFSVMSDIIFNNKGTLDKFIGDAIMAFWGAPVRTTDHAILAVTSAIEMYRGLERVNMQLAQKGYPEIEIGLGINTGDVVLGNIGSEKKLDYTVIGDNVNLASRLEGLTKAYGCPILISEYTFLELGRTIPCAVVDLVRVKGKQQPIHVYWPLALPTDPAATIEAARALAELSEAAFSHYRSRRWSEAAAFYRQMPVIGLRDVFLERCSDYRKQPPAEEWEGVYTLATK